MFHDSAAACDTATAGSDATAGDVTGDDTRVHNRIHKVLEDANIKLSTVLSELLGVSGLGMLLI